MNRIPFNNLTACLAEQEDALLAAFSKVLAGGTFILGPEMEAFEIEFAMYCHANYGVGVANGTDALELALRATGILPGDEVITVANSAPATVAAILRAGGRPIFIDVTPAGLMNPEEIERAITDDTTHILPVHLYGQSCDMPLIRKIAKENNLAVIEDAAQAAGSLVDGHFGYYSEAACFSFYPTKNLGALGDGGMVITDNQAIANRIKELRHYGMSDRRSGRQHNPGWNSRLDEMQAAFLRKRLPLLDDMNQRRRTMARYYDMHLPSVLLHRKYSDWCNYHLYTVKVKNRDQVRTRMLEMGVETGVHYPIPAHQQNPTRTIMSLFETEDLCTKVLSLPLWIGMNRDDQNQVINALVEATNER